MRCKPPETMTYAQPVVLFDLYGTLIDIRTDEGRPQLWERLARFLRYGGQPVEAEPLREAFFTLMDQSRAASGEAHPEFDAVAVIGAALDRLGAPIPHERCVEAARLMRVLSIRRFGRFADALPCLERLRGRARLGLISDAQRLWLEPELAEAGLAEYFPLLVVSSDHGFRKPDKRLFTTALEAVGAAPSDAWYIGDSPERDVGGALGAGIRAIWLRRNSAAMPQNLRPHHTITSLAELPALLYSTEQNA